MEAQGRMPENFGRPGTVIYISEDQARKSLADLGIMDPEPALVGRMQGALLRQVYRNRTGVDFDEWVAGRAGPMPPKTSREDLSRAGLGYLCQKTAQDVRAYVNAQRFTKVAKWRSILLGTPYMSPLDARHLDIERGKR